MKQFFAVAALAAMFVLGVGSATTRVAEAEQDDPDIPLNNVPVALWSDVGRDGIFGNLGDVEHQSGLTHDHLTFGFSGAWGLSLPATMAPLGVVIGPITFEQQTDYTQQGGVWTNDNPANGLAGQNHQILVRHKRQWRVRWPRRRPPRYCLDRRGWRLRLPEDHLHSRAASAWRRHYPRRRRCGHVGRRPNLGKLVAVVRNQRANGHLAGGPHQARQRC